MDVIPKIIHLEQIESTNEYGKQLLQDKRLDEHTIIWTDNQTMGKGRGQNRWYTEKSKNLTFSIVAYPTFLDIANHFYLVKVVSLALVDAISNYTSPVSIKWPNDIYVGENKISGILIENTLEQNKIKSSIIGIGLNVNQTAFDPTLPHPTSLKNATGREFHLKHLMYEIIIFYTRRLALLKNNDLKTLDDDYHQYLYKRDHTCSFKKGETQFNAVVKGVSKSGYLMIITEDGKHHTLDFGDVVWE